MSKQGFKKFIAIPPGDSKEHQEFPEDMKKGKIIHYRQPSGERICLVASFASFLHAEESKQHAAQLFSVRHKIQENHEVWRMFSEYLISLSPDLHFEKYEIDISKYGWEVLPWDPIVTCVIDSRGQDNHCITICDGWIYDSNFSHALPLGKR